VDSGATSSLFGATGDAHGNLVFVGQSGTIVRTGDDGDSFQPLDLGSDRGLYGVVAAANGRIVVTGDGGSTPVAAEPGTRR
jgi:photosystem II stability/assembly factor-like uncharacterized protein